MQRQIRFLMLAALAATACTKDEAAAPAPPASAKPVPIAQATPRVEQPEYVIELLPPEGAAAGAEANAVVHLAARGGFHVNADYPMAFVPDEADGLTFGAKRIALADGAEKTACAESAEDTCEARARVPFTAAKPAKLSGVVAFSICEPDKCLIEKVRLAADVPVKE